MGVSVHAALKVIDGWPQARRATIALLLLIGGTAAVSTVASHGQPGLSVTIGVVLAVAFSLVATSAVRSTSLDAGPDRESVNTPPPSEGDSPQPRE